MLGRGNWVYLNNLFSNEVAHFQLKTRNTVIGQGKVCCADHQGSLDNYLRQNAQFQISEIRQE